jgi:hypothetical protein
MAERSDPHVQAIPGVTGLTTRSRVPGRHEREPPSMRVDLTAAVPFVPLGERRGHSSHPGRSADSGGLARGDGRAVVPAADPAVRGRGPPYCRLRAIASNGQSASTSAPSSLSRSQATSWPESVVGMHGARCRILPPAPAIPEPSRLVGKGNRTMAAESSGSLVPTHFVRYGMIQRRSEQKSRRPPSFHARLRSPTYEQTDGSDRRLST